MANDLVNKECTDTRKARRVQRQALNKNTRSFVATTTLMCEKLTILAPEE